MRDSNRHGLRTAQVEHLRTLRNQNSGYQNRLGHSLHHNLEVTPVHVFWAVPSWHIACITEDIAHDAHDLHQGFHPTDDVEDNLSMPQGILRVFTTREPGLDFFYDTGFFHNSGSSCHTCICGADNYVIDIAGHDIDQCVFVFVYVFVFVFILDHD